MKTIRNHNLFSNSVECFGGNGIMGVLQHFSRQGEDNRAVYAELYAVSQDFINYNNKWYKVYRALSAFFMAALVTAVIFAIGIQNSNLQQNDKTFGWTVVVVILIVCALLEGCKAHYGLSSGFVETCKPIDFDEEQFPALGKFIVFAEELSKRVDLDIYEPDGVGAETFKKKVREWAQARIGEAVALQQAYKEVDPGEEAWAELDERCRRLRKSLRVFSQAGFWFRDWRKKFDEIKAMKQSGFPDAQIEHLTGQNEASNT